MIEDSINFYYKATRLKDMLRQGAVQWQVKKDRLESIAEHTFGCMILAISLQAELNLHLDMEKVLKMLTIHELEELAIGDVTPLDDVDKRELKNKARLSVSKMIKDLKCESELMSMTDDFNNSSTIEAKFAKAIDKLECVLEFKKYQDSGQISLGHVTDKMLQNKQLRAYVDEGKYDLADIFFLFHKSAFEEFGIDEEFWFEKLKNLKIKQRLEKK